MSTVANYQGRSFDLLALRGAKAVGDVLLTQTLFGTDAAGQICTGAQKVAQRWAIEFLTEAGSMPFRPNRGTLFVASANNGRFRSEIDVQLAFQIAAITVRNNLLKDESADMHPEDRFDKATLLQIRLFSESLSLRVQIDTLSGSNRKIILPVALVPTNTRT